MGLIFGWSAIAFLVFMTILEWLRYRSAPLLDGAIPYPRRRFIRRVSIALIFTAALLGALYFPESLPPLPRLAVLAAVLFGALLGVVLVWRDLRETSASVLRANARFQEETAASMEDIVRAAAEKKKSKNPAKK